MMTMKTEKELVRFDVDGLLLDTEEQYFTFSFQSLMIFALYIFCNLEVISGKQLIILAIFMDMARLVSITLKESGLCLLF